VLGAEESTGDKEASNNQEVKDPVHTNVLPNPDLDNMSAMVIDGGPYVVGEVSAEGVEAQHGGDGGPVLHGPAMGHTSIGDGQTARLGKGETKVLVVWEVMVRMGKVLSGDL
jgi:hypothetical protein